MLSVCEALLYAQVSGLDPGRPLDVISRRAADFWLLTNYGPRALKGDFAPASISTLLKDLHIAVNEGHGHARTNQML